MNLRLRSADYLTNRQSYLHGAEQQHVASCPDTVAVGYVKDYGTSAGYLVFYGKQSRPQHHYSAPNAAQARLRVEQLLTAAGAGAEQLAARKKEVKAAYRDTVNADGLTTRHYTMAGTAAVIRQALKKHYAGVKFSVTTEGNSVAVCWENGPLLGEVDQLLSRFEAGHFDGMQDLYVYGDGDLLIDGQGQLMTRKWGAKYVSTTRTCDPMQREYEAAELAWLADE